MTRVQALLLCLGLGGISLTAAAPKVTKGNPANGKVLFEQCAMCHRADSTEKKTGPGLKGLFKKPKLTNGQKATEQTIRAKVETGGGGMPAYKEILSEKELNDVIAYLKTL